MLGNNHILIDYLRGLQKHYVGELSNSALTTYYSVLMSSQRAMPGGRADRELLPKGANGRLLCRWCSLEVPQGRQTFCSDWCVDEWKLRSDPGHLRERVFARDRGVCARCGLDCVAQLCHMRRLRGVARAKASSEWKQGSRRSLWDADHVVPVAEGGGECDLSNMQTLCLKCHRLCTAELRERLARRKAAGIANGV